MRVNHKISLSFFILSCAISFSALGASPLSKYGNIQTVQNYSSNPFWTPDAPYNQRMPTPVYATGTDIETAECQRVMLNLIVAQCATLNNCVSTHLSDIRPSIVMQLSRMPGGNYSTACIGYLDSTFADYVKKYGHAGTSIGNATFPNATMPNPNIGSTTFNTQNIAQAPQWPQAEQQRKQELQALKNASDTVTPGLVATAFPATYDDLSFTERMSNAQQGYAPYKNNSAYKTIKIETNSGTIKQSSGNKNAQPDADFCKKNPNAEKCTKPVLTNNEVTTVPDEILFIL